MSEDILGNVSRLFSARTVLVGAPFPLALSAFTPGHSCSLTCSSRQKRDLADVTLGEELSTHDSIPFSFLAQESLTAGLLLVTWWGWPVLSVTRWVQQVLWVPLLSPPSLHLYRQKVAYYQCLRFLSVCSRPHERAWPMHRTSWKCPRVDAHRGSSPTRMEWELMNKELVSETLGWDNSQRCVLCFLPEFPSWIGNRLPTVGTDFIYLFIYWYLKKYIFIGIQLLYNVVLVSAVQRSDSVTHSYIGNWL